MRADNEVLITERSRKLRERMADGNLLGEKININETSHCVVAAYDLGRRDEQDARNNPSNVLESERVSNLAHIIVAISLCNLFVGLLVLQYVVNGPLP